MKQSKIKSKKNEFESEDRAVFAMLTLIVVVASMTVLSNACSTPVTNPDVVKNDLESKQDPEPHYPHFYFKDFR